MATTKPFSFAAFVEYGNSCINNTTGNTPEIQTAFKQDLKKAIAHAGYPSKEEIGIVDEINDFDMSATLQTVPQIISGFMRDEERAFDIPAADENTAPASIGIKSVPEEVKEGTLAFGKDAGSKYRTKVEAHDEPTLKVRRDKFKSKL